MVDGSELDGAVVRALLCDSACTGDRRRPTCLDKLVLVRARHHHRLHQPRWHAKLRPDATLEVTDPAGRVRSTAPPRAGPKP